MNIGSDNLIYDELLILLNFESGDIVMIFYLGNYGVFIFKIGCFRLLSVELRVFRNSVIVRCRLILWSIIKLIRSLSAEIMFILNNEINIMNNEKESDIFKDNV